MALRFNVRHISLSALICLCLLGMARPAVSGTTPDTPESLMTKAKTYAAGSKAGTALANKLYEDLASKKPFAASIVAAAQKADKPAAAKAIASDLNLSGNQVAVEELDKDILIRGTIKLKGGTEVSYCVDTEGKRCGGHGFSVTVAGE
jgi:hypothetical protein